MIHCRLERRKAIGAFKCFDVNEHTLVRILAALDGVGSEDLERIDERSQFRAGE
jgi:hypothetical protein